MSRTALIALLLATAGCALSTPQNQNDTRQQPSVTTPGVHVSGHVNVGVVRQF